MTDKQHKNKYKVYVKVLATFYPNGDLFPEAFWWESGKKYKIDSIIDVCRAASLKTGGSGIRYTCLLGTYQVLLFYEEGRWFMERKNV